MFWQWGFCRFYVGPDQMAVITAKIGDALPPGQILAKKGQHGIQEDVLGEGRHFLNPWFYEREIRPVVVIPPGKVGVVTSKVGEDLPEGEFLAERGQKGIWRNVLGPGKYRMNPAGYQIDVVDAISIPIGYDGVVTSLSGKQTPPSAVCEAGREGRAQRRAAAGPVFRESARIQGGRAGDRRQPGLAARQGRRGGHHQGADDVAERGDGAPAAERAAGAAGEAGRLHALRVQLRHAPRAAGRAAPAPGEVALGYKDSRRKWSPKLSDEMPRTGSRRRTASLSFVLNQFVEFPSRDGFEISLDMTVEFELLPKNVAWIFRTYGDLPAAVDKVIMPQILSVSRLKGSAYGAKDFIVGEGREKFQNELTDALAQTLAEKRITIHNALIRHVNVPEQILDPIQQASLAQEQDLTNQEKQNTAKKQAELNTELSLIDQRARAGRAGDGEDQGPDQGRRGEAGRRDPGRHDPAGGGDREADGRRECRAHHDAGYGRCRGRHAWWKAKRPRASN